MTTKPARLHYCLVAAVLSVVGCPPASEEPGVERGPFPFDTEVPDESSLAGPAVRVAITPGRVTIQPGETNQVKVTGWDSADNSANLTASEKGTTYLVDDTTVATVSANGLVTAVADGSTALHATNGEASAAVPVTVATRTPAPTGLALTPNPLNVTAAGDQALTATATLAGGTTRNVTYYTEGTTYESSDETIALVSNNGLVTPLMNGQVTITAANRGVTATTTVTITFAGEPGLVRLKITPKDTTLTAADQTVQLHVTGTKTDGSAADLTSAASGTTYRSSNAGIASISADGLVTAHGNGLATIHATNGTVIGQVVVIVLIDGAPAQRADSAWVHGEVFGPTKQPLSDARVFMDGVAGVVKTDAQGRFAFPTPDGTRSFRITAEKQGYSYAHRSGSVAARKHTNVAPIYLIAIDTAATMIGAAGGSHVSSDNQVQLTIPAGATGEDLEVRVTNMTEGRQIPPLPKRCDFTYCVKLEPELATFDRSVSIRVRNTLDFPAGEQIPVGLYAKNVGEWQHLGMATVSEDGQWVDFKTRHFSMCDVNAWERILNQGRNPKEVKNDSPAENSTTGGSTGDDTKPPKCKDWGGSSLISAQTGRLQERHAIPSYRSLGQQRAAELVYNSDLASPRRILAIHYQLSTGFIPDLQHVEFCIAGQRAEAFFQGTSKEARYAWVWDGRDAAGLTLPTGVYEYSVIQSDQYWGTYGRQSSFGGVELYDLGVPGRERISLPVKSTGRVAINRQTESPFGAGWGLVGLQHLHLQSAGAGPIVTDGTGALTVFSGAGTITDVAGTGELGLQEWLGDGHKALDIKLGEVSEVVADGKGNVLIALFALRRIIQVDSSGIANSLAGSGGVSGYSGDGGPATLARLGYLTYGLVRDHDGNLYLADGSNHRVRRIDPAGVITTVAGNGKEPVWADDGSIIIEGEGGPATEATVPFPHGLAISPDGELYISSSAGLQKVDVNGIITTIAGGRNATLDEDAEGVPAVNAKLLGSDGIAFDSVGNLYVVSGSLIRRIDRQGIITTFAGGGNRHPDDDGGPDTNPNYLGDGGPATQAVLLNPTDVAVDSRGNVYISDRGHWRIRCVNTAGVITTVAGGGDKAVAPLPATEAQIAPEWLEVEPTGDLLFGEWQRVRRLVLTGGSATGTWTMPAMPGDFTTLSRKADGTYSRNYPDGTAVNFDAEGYMTSRVDRNGNSTTHTWQDGGDGERLLASVTDPAGKVTTLAYDGNGRIQSLTDPAGRVTQITVDSAGNLTKITNPGGSSRQFGYDGDHQMTSQTDAAGKTTQYMFSANGSVTKVTRADGSERAYSSLQSSGTLDEIQAEAGTSDNPATLPTTEDLTPRFTDATGRTTQVRVNNFGTRSYFKDPLGRELSMGYDGENLLTSITLPSGRQTTYEYNSIGQPTRITDESSGAVTTINYDSTLNLPVSVTDPLGAVWTYEYDDSGNLTRVTDPAGEQTNMTYDARGLLTSVQNALGQTTEYARDGAGNIITVRDGLGHETTLGYDAYGNISFITDPLDRVTVRTYDVMNLLTTVTDPTGAKTQLNWEMALGSSTVVSSAPPAVLMSLIDPRSKQYQFDYDDLHHRTLRRNPDGSEWHVLYDAEGRLVSATDPKNQTTTYTYDAAGRRSGRTVAGADQVTYEYNTDGQITAIIQGNRRIDYTYDTTGRLTGVATAEPSVGIAHTVTYTYDLANRVVGMSESAGTNATYTRDVRGLVTKIAAGDLETTLTYDALLRVAGVELPNGTETAYSYDAAGHPTGIEHTGGGTPLVDLAYAYNDAGEITGITDGDGVHAYTHDAAGQLTASTHPNPGVNPNEAYTYDAAGNRTVSHRSSTYAYDDFNKLTTDQQYTYAFDANGNLVSRTEKGSNDVTSFTYDAQNRLASVQLPDGKTVSYRYDLLGRRIERNADGAVTRYVYDGHDLVAELDAGGTAQARYVHRVGIDNPLLMIRGGTTYAYHPDMIGSIRVMTDGSGTPGNRYTYDSFGRLVAQTGSTANPFTYAGRELDAATGLYYNRARYYDPGVGRFLSPDPQGLSALSPNLYSYVGNQPLVATDPLGLFYIARAVQIGAQGVLGGGAMVSGETGTIYGTSSKGWGCGGSFEYYSTSEGLMIGEGAGVSLAGSFTISPFGNVEDFTGDSVGLTIGGGLLGHLNFTLSVPLVASEGGNPAGMNLWGTALNVSIGAEAGEHLSGGIVHSHTEVQNLP